MLMGFINQRSHNWVSYHPVGTRTIRCVWKGGFFHAFCLPIFITYSIIIIHRITLRRFFSTIPWYSPKCLIQWISSWFSLFICGTMIMIQKIWGDTIFRYFQTPNGFQQKNGENTEPSTHLGFWAPQTIAKLAQKTPITMVYGKYNYS